MPAAPLIRPATAADLPQINAIYNHYVRTSTATYQTEPATEAERHTWFAAHEAPYPVIVATLPTQPHTLIGWAALSPFHARKAFQFTAENSVYVHPDHLRQGIGRALLADLLARARTLPLRTIVAVISADQTPSIALHTALGFTRAGTLTGVGNKFNRWLDVAYLQYTLK